MLGVPISIPKTCYGYGGSYLPMKQEHICALSYADTESELNSSMKC